MRMGIGGSTPFRPYFWRQVSTGLERLCLKAAPTKLLTTEPRFSLQLESAWLAIFVKLVVQRWRCRILHRQLLTMLTLDQHLRSHSGLSRRQALGGLPVGASITELRFRLDTNATITVFPTNTVTWSDYEVTLAQAANPISGMSTNFASNLLSPVLVKSGALSLSPNSFTTSASPNPFGSLVVFDTPYVYQGGDLVMLFRHPGSDSASTAFLDALNSSTPGYGTDFRAFSATSFSATFGIQASVTIAQIVFTYAPRETIIRDGTNVVIVGTDGPPGGTYYIMTSTNITLPISQWIPLATNLFDSSGSFRYTNAINADLPARFLHIALP